MLRFSQMVVGPVVSHLRAVVRILGNRVARLWRQYRACSPRTQILIGAALLILLIILLTIARSGSKDTTPPLLRAVTLEEVQNLSGDGIGSSVLGSVRSVTEAEVLAETSGTVRSVNARIGSVVPAGYVIAELENAAERAAVLQAEGAYDAAVAARTSVSPTEVRTTAQNAYRDAFTDLDTTLENNIDAFFGVPTPIGPDLLINPPGSDSSELSRERARIDRLMDSWRKELVSLEARDPDALLDEAEVIARTIEVFAARIAEAANQRDSRATPEQITSLSAARATISSVLSSISGARTAYRSGATSSTASVDAGVKSALGTLRLAQSTLEKTVVRAPIAGTVNFLPIRIGEYVTGLSHVATVAQNGALEITAFVSENERAALFVGERVSLDERASGVVTAVAPALDPVTKRIEIRIAADADSALTNGQSVRVIIPGASASSETTSGPLLLPLASVKLRAEDRIVFGVDEEQRLVAYHVEIGEVRGDRIEVLTELAPTLRIVTDARGLAEGEVVRIAGE